MKQEPTRIRKISPNFGQLSQKNVIIVARRKIEAGEDDGRVWGRTQNKYNHSIFYAKFNSDIKYSNVYDLICW